MMLNSFFLLLTAAVFYAVSLLCKIQSFQSSILNKPALPKMYMQEFRAMRHVR